MKARILGSIVTIFFGIMLLSSEDPEGVALALDDLPRSPQLDNYFVWPAPEVKKVTSNFGYQVVQGKKLLRCGIDLNIPGEGDYGKSIIAAADGTITKVNRSIDKPSGNSIQISHVTPDLHNWETNYYHLSEITVREGEMVKRGQVIGAVGNTGTSVNGSLLHFTMKYEGKFLNPLPYIIWSRELGGNLNND